MKITRFFLIFFCFLPSLLLADVVVIANDDAAIEGMSQEEISAVFLGRSFQLRGGFFASPFGQLKSSETYALFCEKVLKMPPSQVNSYWTRLSLAGRTTPPRELPNDQAVLNAIQKKKGAIGYVSALPKATQGVRVLLHIRD